MNATKESRDEQRNYCLNCEVLPICHSFFYYFETLLKVQNLIKQNTSNSNDKN